MKIVAYKCPKCKTSHNAKAWNEATTNVYGDPYLIEEKNADLCIFVCPCCNEKSGYSFIHQEKVEAESKNTSKLKYTLWYKAKVIYVHVDSAGIKEYNKTIDVRSIEFLDGGVNYITDDEGNEYYTEEILELWRDEL